MYATRRNSSHPRVHLSTFIGSHHQVCIVLTIRSRILIQIVRKRRRVLKNNERLAHAAKAGTPAPEDVQDQGFTRPSVLILLPFRSSGLRNLDSQRESWTNLPLQNLMRNPPDHVETFGGNPDDNFRVGLKLMRKSVPSPLGLRMSIEKEKYVVDPHLNIVTSGASRNSDFLSSIEIVVADQIDALTMQNWEHTQFVFTHLNQLPKESHDADISRIKPWYLDGRAVYIRQTVMLSAYETPEIRSLFNQSLKNLAGKSAVQSANTVIFVPSSLDFTRIQNHFQKQQLSFAVLSDERFHFTGDTKLEVFGTSSFMALRTTPPSTRSFCLPTLFGR
ncbi:hypothetical protein EDB89DRAFT_2166712 [Lactarius sanguifluus]|nr:hypothetical protein EDB89DRAFT_2166712 [Lactarius sanguifluus]